MYFLFFFSSNNVGSYDPRSDFMINDPTYFPRSYVRSQFWKPWCLVNLSYTLRSASLKLAFVKQAHNQFPETGIWKFPEVGIWKFKVNIGVYKNITTNNELEKKKESAYFNGRENQHQNETWLPKKKKTTKWDMLFFLFFPVH